MENELMIVCPTCGKILRLADSPNINAMRFTCPVCRQKHVVGECQRYAEPPKTELHTGIFVDGEGRTYQLNMGKNTIGRMSGNSTATLQIETDDDTMSLSHAVVDVFDVEGRIYHVFSNGDSQNPSLFNDGIVEHTDKFILNEGDKVTLGETMLTFYKEK